MNTEYRIACRADVPVLLTMMEQFYAIDHYPFEKEKTQKNLFGFLADPSLGKTWVIHDENLIFGYVVLTYGYSFEHGGRFAFVDELYLKKEYRKQGIGALTMDFIQSEAPKLGIRLLHLEVEPHNAGGVKLYKAKGFKDNGRTLLSKKVNANEEF